MTTTPAAATSTTNPASEGAAVETLASLRAAAQEDFADYVIDLGDGHEPVVLQNSLRLSKESRELISSIREDIDAAQEDPEPVVPARKKLNAAQNRLDTALGKHERGDKSVSEAVLEEHRKRVAEERAKVNELLQEHLDETTVRLQMCEVIRKVIRAAASKPDGAERLIAELGDDVTMHFAVAKVYGKKTQLGEVLPSAS